LRNSDINQSLLKSISGQRLSTYLAETGGDLDAALTLYEWNVRLAESLYGPLQCLEISLRNALNDQLQLSYGPDWMDRGASLLNPYATDSIREARSDRSRCAPGELVADLKFSFWISLLGPAYDSTLWRRALHRCFRGERGLRRADIHARLNAIRRFRNRVAHHEPVFAKASQMHGEIIQAIGWMCRHTGDWAHHQSRFGVVYAQGPRRA
jgi:hypothetical protein